LFTGLVQGVGAVKDVSPREGAARIEVGASLAEELEPGDSVLVNGVCLTAVEIGSDRFAADLSAETLGRTALGALRAGDAVNLELPLRLQDRLGGHLVQGHVDAVAEISAVDRNAGGADLWVEAPAAVLRYVVEKGSVTLDGVSLTVAEVDERGFGVSLIPETLLRTNLKDAEPGHRVNLEVDVLAKYVEKLLPANSQDGKSEGP
jgi:riboflavin synthase